MPGIPSSALEKALRAYGANLGALLSREGLTQPRLGHAMKRKSISVSTKTINNILKARHPTQLDKLAALADHFQVPLWMMFVPELPAEVWTDAQRSDRLIKLLADYIHCSDDGRQHTENIAAAYAGKESTREK